MNPRFLHYTAALALLCSALPALHGCRTAPPVIPAAVPAAARPADLEMRFTDAAMRRYISTFPAFYRRTEEISKLGEEDPVPEAARLRILELKKQNEEHVAAKGWSGLDVFVEFNGKVVYYLTVYQVLKRFSSLQSRYPQSRVLHREQMKLLETELGKDGFSVLRRNDWRLRRMYARAGMKELGQPR